MARRQAIVSQPVQLFKPDALQLYLTPRYILIERAHSRIRLYDEITKHDILCTLRGEKKRRKFLKRWLIVHTVLRHSPHVPPTPQNKKRDQNDKEKEINRKAGDAISVGSNVT
jgi:hypothetical protein